MEYQESRTDYEFFDVGEPSSKTLNNQLFDPTPEIPIWNPTMASEF